MDSWSSEIWNRGKAKSIDRSSEIRTLFYFLIPSTGRQLPVSIWFLLSLSSHASKNRKGTILKVLEWGLSQRGSPK